MARSARVVTLGPVTDTSASMTRRSADGQIFGTVLLIVGGGWLLREAGVALSWPALLSIALIALGLGMVVTSHLRGTKWLAATGVALALVLAMTSSVSLDAGVLRGGIGDHFVTVSSASQVEKSYSLGVGKLTLNLSRLDIDGAGEIAIDARVGIGELAVFVPPEVLISVTVDAGAGEASIDGFSLGEGVSVDQRRVDPGFDKAEDRLVLDLGVGVGNIEVHRAAP